MLEVQKMVRLMSDHRLVRPIEKGLSTEKHLQVDTRKLLPPSMEASDNISQKESGSWWNTILNMEIRKVQVYECTSPIDTLLSSALCLLKCPERCCMNWTMYNRIDCISTTLTKCVRLHQLGLYTQTLHDLGAEIGRLAEWPIHFIICESVNSAQIFPMHLNRLGSMVDSSNILVVNPNPFDLTLVLQEKSDISKDKSHPKKRGRKSRNTASGLCQLTFPIKSCKVMCIANKTVDNWDIHCVCDVTHNYILCVMGRYNMGNWFFENLLRGKLMEHFVHIPDPL